MDSCSCMKAFAIIMELVYNWIEHLKDGLNLRWDYMNRIAFSLASNRLMSLQFTWKEKIIFLLLSISMPLIPLETFPSWVLLQKPSEKPIISTFHHSGPTSPTSFHFNRKEPTRLTLHSDSKSSRILPKARTYLKDLILSKNFRSEAEDLVPWKTCSFLSIHNVHNPALSTIFKFLLV